MEYQDEIEILLELRNKIFNEKNNKQKLLYLDDYFNIISYLDKLNAIDLKKEIESIGSNTIYYINKLRKEKERFCNTFFKNFSLIDDSINNIMNIYNDYPLININYQCQHLIKEKDGISLLYDFFGNLNNDFYKLFKNILINGHISYIPNVLSEGMTYTTNGGYGNYIILRKENNYFDYEVLSSLTHEIGHCYEMDLLKDKKIFFHNHLLIEVTSLFIQKLFDLYNINNNIYLKDAKDSRMWWQICVYNKTLCLDFINKCINDNCIEELNPINYTFSILYNEEMIKYLNLQNNVAFQYCTFDITNYLYVIGDYIANNLVGIYKQDPKEALKLLGRFILTYRNKSLKSNLDNYGNDFSETKKLIKEIFIYQRKEGYCEK